MAAWSKQKYFCFLLLGFLAEFLSCKAKNHAGGDEMV